MAHVTGFEYDIFISYTHNDNYGIGGRPGWVDQFHEWLESWLVKRRGLTGLKIWRDGELQGNTEFNVAIENRIKSSALFFALHSRNYVQSEYCRKELEWFHQYNSNRPGGLYVGEQLRIFNILLNNIPHQEWREALGNTSGFPMNDAANEAEFGEFTSPRHSLFEHQLRKIVDAVQSTLSEFPQRSYSPDSSENEDQTSQVFVADVADTLQTFRDRLVADIGQQGATTIGDIPPPVESVPHTAAVKQALSRTDFSIHLLDQWPGRKIFDKKDTTYPREQLLTTLESNTSAIICVPEDLDFEEIDDEAYGVWLASLENDSREETNYEFVRCNQRAFAEIVLQKLNNLQNSARHEDCNSSYLIDTHQKDQRYAYKLADYLADNGVDVDFNKESRDPIQSLSNFEEAVRQVRNLIIMCGKVAPDWLQGRIKRAIKIIAEQFESSAPCTLENIWVFFTPESKGPVQIPNLPPLIRVNIVDNSHSDAIDPDIAASLFRPS